MMKAANNGPAAFGEVEKFDDRESGSGGVRGRTRTPGDHHEGNASDKGEEDEEDEAARKSRLGLDKKDRDDGDEGPRGADLDFDDDDIEKGDDWETSPSTKSSALSKGASPLVSLKTGPARPSGPVTKGEIRAVLVQKIPVTTKDLVAKFKSRLKLKEEKDCFCCYIKENIKDTKDLTEPTM